ncbi:MAG: O-antigen ligase family protein [Elainellaceae cyanobacterium]
MSGNLQPTPMKPQNFPESLIWYSMILTYLLYLVGGLYVLGPVLAVVLLGYLVYRWWYQTDSTPESDRIEIPWIIWVWVAGMLVELVALVVAHLNFDLGTSTMIKSSIGWAKGWALLAIFPMIGCLNIRPQVIYRATCIVGLQTIIVTPFLYLSHFIGLRSLLYTSPLSVLADPLFFQVRLFFADFEGFRLTYFAPWSPAAGMMGNIYFFLALQEKDPKWRWIGVAGSLLMCFLSKARAAPLGLVCVAIAVLAVRYLAKPLFLILLGVATTVAGMVAPMLISAASAYWSNFRSARANSTRVRETLQEIALYRWWNEAPIWGHGVVERGPKLVEFKPIGTHHTIFSLLFVKGIVGLIAFAIPMVLSIVDLVIRAQQSRTALVGFSVILLMTFYSFSANLEVLAYLFWPGLVVMGIAFAEKYDKPFVRSLVE